MDAESRPKWERLGRLLAERRARLDPRYATRKAFAEATGLNLGLLRDIETAVRDSYKAPSLAAIEAAYHWAPGSISQVLNDGEPVEVAHVGGTASMALGGFGTSVAHRSAQGADVLVISETASARRTPRWFTSEVERRGLRLESVSESVHALRGLAEHFGYNLAELLLHAGLASAKELEIGERPDLPTKSGALEDFDHAAERILSSPFLKGRKRREAEAVISDARQEIEENISRIR